MLPVLADDQDKRKQPDMALQRDGYMNYKAIGWTRYGDGRGDVKKYHLRHYTNAITSFAGGGIGKDSRTGMYNTTPYILVEYEL